MARHYILDDEDRETDLFWSDQDGDSPDHQKVYRETPGGAKQVDHLHHNPSDGTFHTA